MRRPLGSWSAVLTACVEWPGEVKRAVATRRVWTVEDLTRELFQDHVGEEFLAVAMAGGEAFTETRVRLAAVHEMPHAFCVHRNGARVTDGFSVVFESDADTMLLQGLYQLTHPDMGECTLFMVPIVGREPGRHCYEAAFNRVT